MNIQGPIVKCSECKSENAARSIKDGHLVCINCGHEGPKQSQLNDNEFGSNVYTYSPKKEITF